MGSASHRLQQRLCVTETEGEEPLAFRINVEKRYVSGQRTRSLPTTGKRGCMRPANSERLRRADTFQSWGVTNETHVPDCGRRRKPFARAMAALPRWRIHQTNFATF